MYFIKEARLVKDSHRTIDQLATNYVRIVSRDSVRIAFTLVAMDGLNICATNIQNAYIQASTSEKHYVIYGPEFGKTKERSTKLYGISWT